MIHNLMVGDAVVIKSSPYSSVHKGEIYIITDIKKNHFGKGKHLYEINAEHKLFREHELTYYPMEEE